MNNQSSSGVHSQPVRVVAQKAAFAQPKTKLFPAIWRWHFYAGLLAIPFIVLLCISGIVWLFKPQIDHVAYGKFRNIEQVSSSYVPYAKQEAAVKALYKEATITSVGAPPNLKRSTEFGVTTADQKDLTVYVNPYTGKVLGDRGNKNTLTNLALELHGTLLFGRIKERADKWGDRLLEIAISWTIIMLITGTYLWWPRGRKRSFKEALTIRRKAKSNRTFWRDLHAVTGIMFIFTTLFLAVTGLMWTGVWGKKYQNVATSLNSSYPEGTWDGVPSKKIEDTIKQGKASWGAAQLPTLPSADSGEVVSKPGHSGHDGHRSSELHQVSADSSADARKVKWDPRKGAPIDAVISRAQREGFKPGFLVTYPDGAKGSFQVAASPDLDPQPNKSAFDERYMYVDQYTGKVVGNYRFKDFGLMAQAADLGIALHEGRQFGLINQIATLAATLAILLSCATAIVMWRKRRPQGIGAPKRKSVVKMGPKIAVPIVLLVIALGFFMPMFGLSLLAILLIDLVVVRRIRLLNRTLGGA